MPLCVPAWWDKWACARSVPCSVWAGHCLFSRTLCVTGQRPNSHPVKTASHGRSVPVWLPDYYFRTNTLGEENNESDLLVQSWSCFFSSNSIFKNVLFLSDCTNLPTFTILYLFNKKKETIGEFIRSVELNILTSRFCPTERGMTEMAECRYVFSGVKCICKDPEDCPEEPAHLCVSVENGSNESMTECEAGAWRCSGKNVRVINIGECSNWTNSV